MQELRGSIAKAILVPGGKGVRKLLIRAGVVLAAVLLPEFSSLAETKESYVVDAKGYRRIIPLAYSVTDSHVSFPAAPDTLSEPQDICTDGKDCLYILDTGNERILKLSPDGEFQKEIRPEGEGALSAPQGIFVDQEDRIYVADTGNHRVAVFDQEGALLYTLTQPDDPLYDQDYSFEPVKVGVNSLGQIYVINHLDYHGFCILNPDNQFKGYFAATRLERNAVREWVEHFASDSQKTQMGKTIPAQHTNFQIAEDGSIYVTTANVDSAQMKRMSSVGKNFYPFTGSFGDGTKDYVMVLQEKTDSDRKFTDVSVDEEGIVSVLENVSGRIYQYDSNGVMLSVFGGTGSWQGRFMDAAAMAQDSRKRIYVLDRAAGSIQCFSPTEFTGKIHQALSLHNHGRYGEAGALWEEILAASPGYPPAHMGLGKTEVKKKNYESALEHYKAAGDRTGYSDAYSKYMKTVLQKYFLWIVLAVILFAAGLVQMAAELKRRADYARRPDVMLHEGRHILLLCLFAPQDAFSLIKYDRGSFRWAVPTGIFLMTAVSHVLQLFVLNYSFLAAEPEDVSLFAQVSSFVAPFFLWVFGFYYVSCIFNGEVLLREVYAASCYALTPYALFLIPLALATNLTGGGSFGYIRIVMSAILLWCLVLLFTGVRTMNHYSAVQTVGTMILSVFAALLMAVIITLFYLLGIKLADFASEVIDECRYFL